MATAEIVSAPCGPASSGDLVGRLREKGIGQQDLDGLVATLRSEGSLQDPKVLTMALSAVGRQHRWRDAIRLVSEMQQASHSPNAFAYNAVLSVCARSRQWPCALNLLKDMSWHSVRADVVTYNSAIHACSQALEWRQAISLVAEMKQQQLELDVITYNAAISACTEDGHECVKGLLSEMRQQRVDLDVVSYSAAICACGDGEALDLLVDMRQSLVEPNVLTWSSAVTSCTRVRSWRKAVCLSAGLSLQSVEINAVVCNASVSGCAAGGKWDQVLRMWRRLARHGGIESDVVTLNAAVGAYRGDGEWWRAFDMLDAMLQDGLESDGITFSIATSVCSDNEAWMQAVNTLECMRRQRLPVVMITYGAAISSCAEQWMRASGLFTSARRGELEPDIIAYTATISACEKGGAWQHAHDFLGGSRETGRSTNVVAYNAAISAGARIEGVWRSACRLLCASREHGVQADGITYTAVLDACKDGATTWHCAQVILTEACVRSFTLDGMARGSVMSRVRDAGFWERASVMLHDFQRDLADHDERPLDVSSRRLPVFLDISMTEGGVAEDRLRLIAVAAGLVAAAKPPGLTSEVAILKLRARLGQFWGGLVEADLTSVSRLDGATSGVLVAAIGGQTSAATHMAQAQFAGRFVAKEYFCLCGGPPCGSVGARGNMSASLHHSRSEKRTRAASAKDVMVSFGPWGKQALTLSEVLATWIVGSAESSVGAWTVSLISGGTFQRQVCDSDASRGRCLFVSAQGKKTTPST